VLPTQIREHLSAKPAIILHPSGTVVTFAELEARANRLAHHFRRAGLREGDTVAAILEEAGKFARDVLDPLNAVGDREGAALADGDASVNGVRGIASLAGGGAG